jgi:competence protein ComEA
MTSCLRWVPGLLLVGPLLVLPAGAAELPDGTGKDIVMNACSGCHKAEDIPNYRRTPEEWETIVARMVQRGARVADSDRETVVGYLAKNFPKVEDPNKVNVNKATAKELETGLSLTAKEAEAVVQYREKNGNFRAWGDLLVIYGLDGRKIQAAKDRLSF